MAIETRGRLSFDSSSILPEQLNQLEGQGEISSSIIRHCNNITYQIKDEMNKSSMNMGSQSQNNSSRRRGGGGEDVLLFQQRQHELTPDQLPPVQFNILGQMQMRKPLSSESPNSIKNYNQTILTTMDHQISNSRTHRYLHSHSHSHSHSVSVPTTTTTTTTTQGHTTENRKEISKQNNTSNNSEPDSPLDFSFTTKKTKLEKSENQRESEMDSPCSRLRNILSMKSPDLPEDLAGTVLNLSKETQSNNTSPNLGWNSTNKSVSGSPESVSSVSMSNSCSPILSTPAAFVPSPQQQTIIPVSISMPPLPGPQVSSGNNVVLPMTFSPFGSFSGNLSPILSHTIPSSSGLSLPFDSQPFYSHHIMPGNGSTIPFGNGLSLPSGTIPIAMNNIHNNHGCSNNTSEKSRGTRPFKAYPKDPMNFPTVGIYGLPINTTPGTTESLLHQQSNRAYADFRKQMLSRGQAKSRRGGQRNISLQDLSDANSMSTEPLSFGLELIEPGAMSSGAEDSHSNCEEGYGIGKSGSMKSERQAKDEAYWERRRKNNEAAKRSRDARRAKEDEIAIRAVFLEQENMKLRLELCTLRNETAKMRCMLYSPT